MKTNIQYPERLIEAFKGVKSNLRFQPPWLGPTVDAEAPRAKQFSGNRKILVVDDEPGFTQLMKIALPHYDICVENNPQCAIATALEFRPDLILLDVIMPIMDGGDVAAQLSSEVLLRSIPIVFLTGIVSTEEAGDAPKLVGGYPFLHKPFNVAALEICIETHVRAWS